MSVMGTGIAAAVAGTASTAKEQSKVRDKRERDDRDRSQAIRDAYEAQLNTLEEGEDDSQTRLYSQNVHNHPPKNEPDHDDVLKAKKQQTETEAVAPTATQTTPLTPDSDEALAALASEVEQANLKTQAKAKAKPATTPTGDAALYQHLDIKA